MIEFSAGRAAGGDHAGEQAVQERAGEGGPGRGSPMFGAEIPLGFVPFLRAQHMLIAGAANGHGALWSTVLTGRPGFVQAADERTIAVDALPAPGDPLHGAGSGSAAWPGRTGNG
ncbi:hypothetical protein [Catenuloplanes indicus]|uniref:Uncharacterized protein n=1 Tax=Catenuloplanes indicus TaxID=137267 RepID=A0AAE3W6C5_9ACTN|nr:hypothetical protein [Catenuloplanes indicus]MDQ0370331.1 hypothetical protein [Catenuloplanes indicus]